MRWGLSVKPKRWGRGMNEAEWEALVQGVKSGDPVSTQEVRGFACEVVRSYLRGRQQHLLEPDIAALTREATARVFRYVHGTAFAWSPREAFRSLLEKATEHVFLDFLRRTSKQPNGMAGPFDPPGTASPEPPDPLRERHELLRAMDHLVSQSTAPEADVFRLYCAGRTIGEIARCLGLARGQVVSHVSKARKRLRELLPEDADLLAAAGTRYPLELRQWALRNLDVEEATATLKELKENGGLRLRDFLDELEQIVEGK